MHFGPRNVPSHWFGVATSTGAFEIYQLKKRSEEYTDEAPLAHPIVEHIKTIQYFPDDVLITAFSWHPQGWSIGMTLSSGQVCLGHVDPHNDNESNSSIDMTTHDQEAWTLVFSPDGSGMYSGGDDSALQFMEVAMNSEYHQGFAAEPEYGPVRKMPWTDKKIHGAGVTAILPLYADADGSLVLSGSYDDHIRLVQIPAIGRRTVLSEMNLGGGVWRLKLLSSSPRDETSPQKDVIILASCMHAGARIVKLAQDEESNWHFKVLAKFEEHKSMNYGSDCQLSLDAKGQRTFITTSFYDRLLCLWKY